MCDPATIIAGTSLAVGIAGDVMGANAQNKRSKQVAQAADANAVSQTRQLDVRSVQEQEATSQSILQADRQARFADAQARVSAGEAGVAGASVDALLGDIERQHAEYRQTANENLSNTLDQIQEEKVGVRANAASVKAGAPPANPFATAVQIAGQGLQFGNFLIQRRTKANTP